nr:ankyrin repeat-containing protein [Tanacetum cinerariifolium]
SGFWLPIFNGEDAYGWVYLAERFFEVQGFVTTRERLRAADGNLYEQFLKINQDGTAREYVTLFETLAAQLEGISENILEGTFIKGLKQDLRHSVRVLQPKGLSQTIELALIIDETRNRGGTEARALDTVEVSAHSVAGITSHHTMKLRGTIQGFAVVVLIDSGATHNFVSLKLVEALNLCVTGNRKTGVTLGNGRVDACYGICRGIYLQLPGLMDGDKQIILRGEPGLQRGESSLRALARGFDDIDEGFVVALASLHEYAHPESH